MCGIFGIIDIGGIDRKKIILSDLISLSCRRGMDAAGICVFGEGKVSLIKRKGSGEKLIKILPEIQAQVVIGQTRLATNGGVEVNENNQPMREGKIWLVHNGIIINTGALSKKYHLKDEASDTRVLAKILNSEYKKSGSIRKSIIKVASEIAGTINIVVATKKKGKILINFATNSGSIYIGKSKGGMVVASERYFLEKIDQKFSLGLEIEHLLAGNGCEIEENGVLSKYDLGQGQISNERARLTRIPEDLKSHTLDKRIRGIKRCVKCILPVNTPNISFDKSGVCNYCRDYQKIKIVKDIEYDKLIKANRSKDGKPDCILAFSGGRDSAYGLHYLVKKMGMHPVAVTFDWGMISDIGRRNQARMLGKLGIEQIIVSADLSKVRDDIKKNLKAWLYKPDLGMVPLLMQADKVTEYYVDKIRKELNLKLVFFCRGNQLEREEFKAGYCGVLNADPGGVIHNYPVLDKIRLLVYYIKQFFLNPYYLNSSLWSSMLGYLVTYVIPHNYIYLWHHIKWDEAKIIKLLKKEYGWEDDGEVGITWRIDDGSPAFYNYLYGQIQGFTENDSFRSNQIREGIMIRQKALEIVSKENRPRYGAMAWYFDKIGLNGHEVLSVIDQVEKKY